MKSMLELIKEIWFLKRDIVSDDFDKALNILLEEINPDHTAIHEYPTGEKCWTWKVPEKWTCHEAYLETLDGKRLIDYADHPLQVISYSLPYEGVVDRSELLEHIHIHPKLEEVIPFVFKYYERDWGFCTTQEVKASLTEESYRVVIRTSFDDSTLKVGEITVLGESEETIMLVAHLCHPAMANDDLSGVVVGLDAIKYLIDKQDLHYTYRFLILPETIGSVAYLSHNEKLIPKMVGGVFLEMLGNDSPHALQQSFQPNSQIDKCFIIALNSLDPDSYYAPYRTVICNDERQFNAPGVRVPMLSLSRVEPADSATRPYREYHSSLDTPEIITPERLEESKEILLGLIDAFENNYYVINRFKGEIFCSGYGIWVDYRTNPEGHKRLFEIMERCDGEKTIADIAFDLDISFQSVWEIIQFLKEKELVRLSRVPASTSPHRKHF